MSVEKSPVDVLNSLPTSIDDEEMGKRLVAQAFELWINPEIEKRRSLGTLPTDFELYMAQRIQRPTGENLTRLNDEVTGLMNVRAQRDVQKGDPVYISDLDTIVGFDLDEADLDSGHWTLIRTRERWFVSFNFLSQRAKCRDLFEKATQFLFAARQAFDHKHAAVAVDTLFSACELISKAELVSSNMLKMDARKHSAISSSLNAWRRLGNIEGAFVDLFNELGRLRTPYRYDAVFSEAMPISADSLELVDAMIQRGISRVAHRGMSDGPTEMV